MKFFTGLEYKLSSFCCFEIQTMKFHCCSMSTVSSFVSVSVDNTVKWGHLFSGSPVLWFLLLYPGILGNPDLIGTMCIQVRVRSLLIGCCGNRHWHRIQSHWSHGIHHPVCHGHCTAHHSMELSKHSQPKTVAPPLDFAPLVFTWITSGGCGSFAFCICGDSRQLSGE